MSRKIELFWKEVSKVKSCSRIKGRNISLAVGKMKCEGIGRLQSTFVDLEQPIRRTEVEGRMRKHMNEKAAGKEEDI